jgi:hypothetical protein
MRDDMFENATQPLLDHFKIIYCRLQHSAQPLEIPWKLAIWNVGHPRQRRMNQGHCCVFAAKPSNQLSICA